MKDKLKQFEPILVRIDEQQFTIDPGELLKIDYNQIREHLLKYPGDFAWVGANKEAISKEVSEAEFEVEMCYARLDSKYRAAKSTKGRDADRDIKNSIILDSEYITAKRHLFNLEHTAGKVKAVLASLAKLDSVLIQLSTLYKQETQRSQ